MEYDGRGSVSSTSETLKCGFPSQASWTIFSRCSGDTPCSTSLCGGIADGTNTTSSSPSASLHSSATYRCAICTGLNVPPNMPIFIYLP